MDTALGDKFEDLSTPGFSAEFTPDEAETAGAYVESALSEQDALDASND